MTRVLQDSDRPWLPIDADGENFMKIISVDEARKQVVLIVKFAPNAIYPKHLHNATAVAYTLEGEWEYEEGVLKQGTWGIEPPGTEHTPIVSPQGATILAVMTSDSDEFVEIPFEDGTSFKQDFAYWKRMYEMTPEDAAREVGMHIPMEKNVAATA